MLVAIIGDMVGSIYEFHPIKSKEFNIYNPRMKMTDDSVLTLGVMETLMKHYPLKYDEESIKAFKKDLILNFIDKFHKYPAAGFGGMFYHWCASYDGIHLPLPYNSFGNGSAMRISPVAWISKDIDEVKRLSKIVSEITHNHPEGIKGAEAVAISIYLALHGYTKEQIKEVVIKDYYPEIEHFDFEDLIKNYRFNETCQKSVPQALYCFFVSNNEEDTIRNCVAIGGDCDTTGAMAGAIAEAYYSKDKLSSLEERFYNTMIDNEIKETLIKFYHLLGNNKI